jgi:cardiolipin synthase A/B
VSIAWREGNRVELLQNGEEFFPRVFAAIAAAKKEVLLETFILFEDRVGKELQAVLIAAAARGVRVEAIVDDFGSPGFSPDYTTALTRAGVRLHAFDPHPRLLGMRTNVLYRLHRKIVVVDGQLAFVGGINFSADHLLDFGAKAKDDFAAAVVGPVVGDIHAFVLEAMRAWGRPLRWRRPRAQARVLPPDGQSGNARALFVVRDNERHTTDIEREYLRAIAAARRDVLIANAYFFPGYRLLRGLRQAAGRGVKVRLLLPGQNDIPLANFGARLLYRYLLRDGVEIYEYQRRQLHAKVAVIDDDWVTIGSSNLEPLSLSINLEANLVVRDSGLAAELRQRLSGLLADATPVELAATASGQWWRAPFAFVVYHCLRHVPAVAARLPVHRQRLAFAAPDVPGGRGPAPLLRPRWRQAFTYAFFALVVGLLAVLAAQVDWGEVFASLSRQRPATLLAAAVAAFGSYAVYSTFDVLGKIYTHHPLSVARILPITFVCYAFNLNLSAWVGGIALRYRLYSRHGLDTATITKVFTLSVMTNWLGYIALAGTVFGFGQVHLPPGFGISVSLLRGLGFMLLAIAGGYLLLCALSKRRSFRVRGHEVGLPSARLAVTQLALGAFNWGFMALVIFILLEGRADYGTVLATLLLSAVAGIIAHIPGGLGVLEGIFIAILGHQIQHGTLLAALIAYRALYFLLPLGVATIVYLLLETRAARLRIT